MTIFVIYFPVNFQNPNYRSKISPVTLVGVHASLILALCFLDTHTHTHTHTQTHIHT